MTTHLFPVKYRDHAAALWAERDDHISNHLRAGRFYEAREGELLDVLYGMRERFADEAFIDVGAHVGNHSMFFVTALGMTGAAMEPNPASLKHLLRNVAGFGVEVWATPAWMISDAWMVLDDGPDGNTGMASCRLWREGDPDERVLHSMSIDAVAADMKRPIGLIKIDVEGMEDHVLSGARETIRQWKPVIAIETNDPEGLCPEGYTIIGTKNSTPTWVLVPETR